MWYYVRINKDQKQSKGDNKNEKRILEHFEH